MYIATSIVKLFSNYKPETRKAKRDRLRAMALIQSENRELNTEKPVLVKYGLTIYSVGMVRDKTMGYR